MSVVELINAIRKLQNKLAGKFELTRGVRLWVIGPDGETPVAVTGTLDGKLATKADPEK